MIGLLLLIKKSSSSFFKPTNFFMGAFIMDFSLYSQHNYKSNDYVGYKNLYE